MDYFKNQPKMVQFSKVAQFENFEHLRSNTVLLEFIKIELISALPKMAIEIHEVSAP